MNIACLKAVCCRKRPLACDPELLHRGLEHLVILVTGGSGGHGRLMTLQLLTQGATVIVCCRNPQDPKCISLRQEANMHPGTLYVEQLDLSCCGNVRAFVNTFEKTHGDLKLNCIINNAGIMGVPSRQLSKDGFEMQFQTNYLSHFLLVELLMKRLIDSSTKTYMSRIINISSSNAVQDGLTGAHGTLDLDDVNFEQRTYSGFSGYGQSKLAQILHARELSKLYAKDGVKAVSVHPGSFLSNITRNLFPYFVRVLISPSERCLTGQINSFEAIQTCLHCTLSPGSALESGAFYSQVDSPLGNRGGWPLHAPDNPQSYDDKLAFNLYRRSLLWTKEK
jgi:NAD(P)-dependent dehydrogenase (short-subunit alcohol dehydrogenase family)